MNPIRIEEQFELLQRGVAFTGETLDALRREHRAEIDALRLEIETLRRCLLLTHPELAERYGSLHEQVLQETDPETP